MFLANQIAGFFNQLFLWSKIMKQKIIFCMSGQIQENLKLFFIGGRVEWTRLKIDMGTLSIGLRKKFHSQKGIYGASLFFTLFQFLEILRPKIFLPDLLKNRPDLSGHGTLNLALSQEIIDLVK